MEYTALLEKQIQGRLKIDNPWWTEGKIPSYYQMMTPRLYLDIFYPLVKDVSIQRALILMGPRRVGKTVMLYHSIQRLIDEGVSPQNIIYVSVETPIYNNILLELLFTLAKQILGKEDSKESQSQISGGYLPRCEVCGFRFCRRCIEKEQQRERCWQVYRLQSASFAFLRVYPSQEI